MDDVEYVLIDIILILHGNAQMFPIYAKNIIQTMVIVHLVIWVMYWMMVSV